MPPSWIIPGVWFVQKLFQRNQKRDADAYPADRRGSRNTLRLFRLPYVKYSTGANRATRIFYRAMRKPDLTVARRAFGLRKAEQKTHNGTTRLSARKRYFRVLRLFFAYFFLARQKKVCPRSDSCGRAINAALRCNRRGLPCLRHGIAPSGHKSSSPLRGDEKLRALPGALICSVPKHMERHIPPPAAASP